MGVAELGWVDLGAAGLMLFLVIQGLYRGCSGQLGRLFAMVSAAAFAYYGFKPVFGMVLEYGLLRENPFAARLIALVLVVVVSLTVWLILHHWLSDTIGMALRQPFDAILGGVIGGTKAFIIIAMFCTFIQLNPVASERNRLWSRSHSIRWLAPLIKHFSESNT